MREGMAITAWHVVRDARRAAARFSDGQEFEVTGLIDKDESRDLALIRIRRYGRPLLELARQEPEVGSKVYVIGAPRGLEFSISDGLLSQVQVIDGAREYQFSCPASPGNSGGPLIAENGEVVGIVSWQVRDGQNLNFAVPSIYALALDASLPTQAWDTVKATTPMSVRQSAPAKTPDELLASARTLCVVVSGSPVLYTEITKKLIPWGRLSIVSDPGEADLLLSVAQTGNLNLATGAGNQAAALLKHRESGVQLWSTTKGGSWALSGWSNAWVGRSIADEFMKFFDKRTGPRKK